MLHFTGTQAGNELLSRNRPRPTRSTAGLRSRRPQVLRRNLRHDRTELAKPAALQPRGGIWLKCGMHQLHVGVQVDFTPATKAHPAIRVLDMVALRSRL